MISPSYGKIEIKDVPKLLLEYYEKNKHYDSGYEITIGTDSQNFSDTKVVVVIAMRCIGHGGIYAYDVLRVDRINDVRMKLNFETNLSLQYANQIMEIIELHEKYHDMYANTNFAIHVDAGNNKNGKTKDLIPGIVGWIKAMGYECVVKPDSYTSSSIADKISK